MLTFARTHTRICTDTPIHTNSFGTQMLTCIYTNNNNFAFLSLCVYVCLCMRTNMGGKKRKELVIKSIVHATQMVVL